TVMSNGYRTLSQHLNDLKKENFSLKLRIYFLEERIQQKYEESSEDVYRTVSGRAADLRWVGVREDSGTK
uniref:Centrosomin N-terminal motif 1 domain-containing protein n=1 Tax=Fundulus heteroclitus TaxID=8078 RepID=A0A3Q2Q707_FUNHE